MMLAALRKKKPTVYVDVSNTQPTFDASAGRGIFVLHQYMLTADEHQLRFLALTNTFMTNECISL